MCRLALITLIGLLCFNVQAGEGAIYLDIHGLSHHAGNAKFNRLNTGVGMTYTLNSTTSLSVGSYHNSYWRNTKYLTYNKQFYANKHIRVGVSGGVATGYASKLVLFPTISIGDDWRVNVGMVPEHGDNTTSAVFMSIRVRLF